MKEFEYLIRRDDRLLSELDYLNDLGSKGWELVDVVIDGDIWSYYFKREINKPK